MRTWWLPVDKKRQRATQAPSETDNLKHVVSTACRPGVFQIALFKGVPNTPYIPPPYETPSGHK